jgi:hypothetical protein
MFRLIQVQDHERGLWFRRGKFEELILPGSTWLLSWQDNVVVIDIERQPRFDHPLLAQMLDVPRLREQLEVIKLDELERAFVWREGRLIGVVGPGLHGFWKTDAKLSVETFNMPAASSDAFVEPEHMIHDDIMHNAHG